jgi:asparagine synthetase B (glutamine-hydrolysing)
MTAVNLRDSVDALSAAESPCFVAVYRPGSNGSVPALTLDEGARTATIAADDHGTAVFSGHLFERADFARRAGVSAEAGDAEIVLAAFRHLGDEALAQIRGAFALAVQDRRTGELVFARDQLGHHPFFYAEGRNGFYLSDSIAALARHPDVSSDVNRPAIAEFLIHRFRSPDETYFAAIQRARSGWLYRVGREASAARYWFPVDPKGPSDWLGEDDLGRFGELMEQAVARAAEPGATAIFLSGGLDSVTVATYAADVMSAAGEDPPLALSLVFPEFDETAVQTEVATSLGLPHELVHYEEATDSDSLVLSAVRTSGTWPMPLVNLWQPLYTHLALRARDRGTVRILTGAGGDEWLQVSPQWGFSRLRRLHLGEMRHLYRTYLQSYNLSRGPLLKNLLWRYGLRHTLRNAAVQGFAAVAPGLGSTWKERRFRESKPEWLAPSPEVEEEMARRASILGAIESASFRFAEDNFPFLENQLGSMEREEAFERGRRLGTETYMPFWDADLDAFLARIPPHLMNQGYWSKGLVRGPLARRFPRAGFEKQKKILSTTLATRLMADQIPGAWKAMGGAQALADSGIIDPKRLESDVERRLTLLQRPVDTETGRVLERAIATHGIWTVLNVESWLRQWV